MSDSMPLGPADLLVESGQGFVEGWTIQRVMDYAAACVAAERERMRNDIHSCGPTCDRAGCVNARLRAEIERLVTRVESLRGLAKTAVGMLHDADRTADAETIHALIGDMEALAVERVTPPPSA